LTIDEGRLIDLIPLDCRAGFPATEAATLSAGDSVELTVVC
jgi:hypothetical protein